MNNKTVELGRKLLQATFTFFLILIGQLSFAQWVTISGTVYDITKQIPIEYVSVLSASGYGTTTDSLGQYTITVKETDSIYFSFLNKPTPKYAVNTIKNPEAFNISIQKRIGELPAVFVKKRNYRMDSLQNRREYDKVFNYKKPGVRTSMTPGLSVGLDVNEFIKMFQFKKNRRMVAFQRRLLREEQEAYINHRFSKRLVKQLTGLEAPAIDSFMVQFRPTLEMVQQMNDLEFGQFIVEAHKYFKAGIKVNRNLFFNRNPENEFEEYP